MRRCALRDLNLHLLLWCDIFITVYYETLLFLFLNQQIVYVGFNILFPMLIICSANLMNRSIYLPDTMISSTMLFQEQKS